MVELQMLYNPNNTFAKIIRGEIPSKKIFENDVAIAFYDINPKAKVHAVVIPKVECIDFDDFMNKSDSVGGFFRSVQEVAHILKLENYKIVTNKGSGAGQVVFHFHVHILSDNISNV